ncbi:MAG: alpha/beta fold hydrolase [Chloroflexota bacterium]
MPDATPAPFDLDRFLALPRLSALRCAPEGSRLVVAVARPHPDGKRFASALWELDPTGSRPARRLTRSAPGESSPAFLRDGSLVFTSARADAAQPEDRQGTYAGVAALWHLPATGGEARPLVSPHGGIDALAVAAGADVVVFTTGIHPGAATLAEDEARETARTKAGVDARLFDDYPIREWDHYLGPRETRLYAGVLTDDPDAPLADVRDLAPDAAGRLRDVDIAVSPDGRTVVTGWRREEALTRPCLDLVAIDRATGTRRTLAAGDAWHGTPVFSPDGAVLACIRTHLGGPGYADRPEVVLIDLATGTDRVLGGDLGGAWPHDLAWTPDGSALVISADRDGRVALLRCGVADGSVAALAAEGAWTDPAVAPDGSIWALHAAIDAPPRPARCADGRPVHLPFPGLDAAALALPSRTERVTATAPDGTPVGSWLVLPEGASATTPAPLAVFIHGGPIGSWSTWHWRWNPHLLAARGYAVLLPDPALSTGYGQAFVDRGWGRWGAEPYTDLMAAVDAAVARPEIDGARTAALGGSFGGYMANWVAGQTDRFRAIVTHASLWELRGFHGTTDHGPSWEVEFGDPYADPARYLEHSPHRFVDRIRTPMLVIHGELDHRVPISEALRLWTDLRRHGVPSRFLYFPDENHWVLKPQNARLWYGTVLAFLDAEVRGHPWTRPDLV